MASPATTQRSYAGYLKTLKEFYESDIPSADIVGLYKTHERYPYETFLLYEHGDIRKPIFADCADKVALDFACGPGRMILRMSKIFARVDGVDLSAPLIKEAQTRCPDSKFWLSNGDDLGDVPGATYDFVYSTIALQHICVHSIRMKIFHAINAALKPGGKTTLQMGFNPRFPFSKIVSDKRLDDGRHQVVFARDDRHAAWNEDRVDATALNSACDVGIGANDLGVMMDDLSKVFSNVDYWFHMGVHFDREPGEDPFGYWPSHWLFVHALKR